MWGNHMADVKRVSAEEAHEKVESGRALLVCAYEDEQKCSSMKLEGALTLNEFLSRLSSISKDQEIIFYCA